MSVINYVRDGSARRIRVANSCDIRQICTTLQAGPMAHLRQDIVVTEASVLVVVWMKCSGCASSQISKHVCWASILRYGICIGKFV